jgi:hypothetical protein
MLAKQRIAKLLLRQLRHIKAAKAGFSSTADGPGGPPSARRALFRAARSRRRAAHAESFTFFLPRFLKKSASEVQKQPTHIAASRERWQGGVLKACSQIHLLIFRVLFLGPYGCDPAGSVEEGTRTH